MKYSYISLLFLAAITFSQAGVAADAFNIVNAPIQEITYDDSTMTLKIFGNLPSTCAAMPQPELVATSSASTLSLNVVAVQSSDICAFGSGGDYELAFDIRSLKFNIADLKLNPNQRYKIISRTGDFAVDFDFNETPFTLPYASENVVGQIQHIESENKFVLFSNDQVFEVNSPMIDLSTYSGLRVEVQGHVLKQKISGMSLIQHEETPKVLLLTGLNTTSY